MIANINELAFFFFFLIIPCFIQLLQSYNPLCYHPLQTEDELELVNEVIFPMSVTRMSRWQSTVHTDCMWFRAHGYVVPAFLWL